MKQTAEENALNWMAQWKSAALALEEVRTAELRALDDRGAVIAFSRVAPSSFVSLPSSGLVTQQQIFLRGRR